MVAAEGKRRSWQYEPNRNRAHCSKGVKFDSGDGDMALLAILHVFEYSNSS